MSQVTHLCLSVSSGMFQPEASMRAGNVPLEMAGLFLIKYDPEWSRWGLGALLPNFVRLPCTE